MRAVSLALLLIATVVVADSFKCSKETCGFIRFYEDDDTPFERKGHTTATVNGISLSSDSFTAIPAGKVTFKANPHASGETQSRIVCISFSSAKVQLAQGLELELQVVAGEKYECRVETSALGQKDERDVASRDLPADVKINKGGDAVAVVGANRTYTFTLTVTNGNAGDLDLAHPNVTVIDNIDPRLRVTDIVVSIEPVDCSTGPCTISCTTDPATSGQYIDGQGDTRDFLGNNLTCFIPEIAPGNRSVAAITIHYRTPLMVEEGENLTVVNEVSIWSNVKDAESANNKTSYTMELQTLTNVDVTITSNAPTDNATKVPYLTAGADDISGADPKYFTFTVCNNPVQGVDDSDVQVSPALDVTLNVTLPPSFVYLGGSGGRVEIVDVQLPSGGYGPTPWPGDQTLPFGCTVIEGLAYCVDTTTITCTENLNSAKQFNCSGWNLLSNQCQVFRVPVTVYADGCGQVPDGCVEAFVANVNTTTDEGFYTQDNRAVQPVLIKIESEIRITKSSSDCVEAGQNTTYNLLIANNGPSLGYQVKVNDTVPFPFQVLDAHLHFANGTVVACELSPAAYGQITIGSKTYGSPTWPTNLVRCDLGLIGVTKDLGDDQKPNIQILVYTPTWADPTITDPVVDCVVIDGNPARQDTQINNTGYVSSLSYDPEIINTNQDPAGLNIWNNVTLAVQKHCELGVVVGGVPGPYHFSIDVTNVGPADARGVKVVDDFNETHFNINQNSITFSYVSGATGNPQTDLDIVCTFNQDVVMTCTFGNLFLVGTTVRITIAYEPVCTLPGCEQIPLPNVQVPNYVIATSWTGNSVRNAPEDSCTTTLQPPPNVRVQKLVDGEEFKAIVSSADPFGVHWYTIIVTNDGPGNATHVTLTDTMDDEYLEPRAQDGEYVGSPAVSETFAQACGPRAATTGKTIQCVWATLGPQESITLRFPFDVPYGTDTNGTMVPNCADVIADLDRVPTDNHACANVTIEGGAKLIVNKSSEASSVCAGEEPSSFILSVKNEGPNVAKNVTLTDELIGPFNTSAAHVTSVIKNGSQDLGTDKCTITHPGSGVNALISCSLGDLEVDSEVIVIFSYYAGASATPSNIGYPNTVTARTNTALVTGSVTVKTIQVPVCARYTPKVRKYGLSQAIAGCTENDWIDACKTTYVYTIEVTNAGPADIGATDKLTVTDILPLNFRATNVDYDIVGGSCSAFDSENHNIISCDFDGPFPANARTELIRITVRVLENAPADMRTNCANLTYTPPAGGSITEESVLENCTDTQVLNQVDLWVNKSVDNDTICAGEDARKYTITLFNLGPSRAYNVALNDSIPPELTYKINPESITVTGSNVVRDLTNADCTYHSDTHSIECQTLGDFRPASSFDAAEDKLTLTYELLADANQDANTAGVINTAIASSGCWNDSTTEACARNTHETTYGEPHPNEATVRTYICANADVSIEKSAHSIEGDDGNFVAGHGGYTFTLVVSNGLGHATAKDVQVSDTDFFAVLGSRAAPTNIVPSVGTCDALPALHCALGDLEPGASATITITFDLYHNATCGPVNNTAAAQSTKTHDPDTSNNEDTIEVPIVTWHDLHVTKDGDRSVVAGGASVAGSVSVTNDGPSDAQNVVLVDTLEDPLQFDAIPTGCTTRSVVGGTQLVCVVGELVVGASKSFDYTVKLAYDAFFTANEAVSNKVHAFSGDWPSCEDFVNPGPSQCEHELNVTNNCAEIPITLDCSVDLKVTKTDHQENIMAGSPDTYTYVIEVSNLGLSLARGVTLIDAPYPAEAMHFENFVTNPSTVHCQFNSPTEFECLSIPDLLPPGVSGGGNVVRVEVNYKVHQDAPPGVYTNFVTVSSSCSNDVNPDNNKANDTTTVFNKADLEIIKDDCTGKVIAGDPLPNTFRFIVFNHGPSVAVDAVVKDTIPAIYKVVGDIRFTGKQPDGPCEMQDHGALGFSFQCTYTNFLTTDEAVILIDVQVAADQEPGYVTNCARVESSVGQEDPNLDNNVDCDINQICTRADVQITKELIPGECIVAGGSTDSQYRVVVSNHGPSYARDVIVHEHFPADIELGPLPENCTVDSIDAPHNVSCQVGTLTISGDGSTREFVFTFRAPANATIGIIRNYAEVVSSTYDHEPCNNNVTLPSLVCAVSDLGVEKTDGVLQVTAGETTDDGSPRVFTYTITGTNYGPSDAYDVVLTDVWPTWEPGFIPLENQPVIVKGEGTCAPTQNPKGYKCSFPHVAVDDTVVISISYTVHPCMLACEACNSVAIRSDSGAPESDENHDDSHSNVAVDCNLVRTEADIQVTKTDGVTTVVAGEKDEETNQPIQYTYHIQVCNNGPSCAQAVNLVDHWPAQVIRIPGTLTTSQGSCVDTEIPGPGSFSCTLLTLHPGECVNVSATYTVPASVATCSVTNVAIAHSVTFDPTQCNNEASDVNALVEKAELVVTKEANVGSLTQGHVTPHAFSIRVWNKGPSYARDVMVTDVWPWALRQYPETIKVSQGTAVTTGGDVTVTIGDIAPGEEHRVTITIPFSLADEAPLEPITNLVSAFSPTDTQCRDAEITLAVNPSKKRDVHTAATKKSQGAASSPKRPSFERSTVPQAPKATNAPIAVDSHLAIVRADVSVKYNDAKRTYTVTVENPNQAPMRLNHMTLRFMTNGARPFDLTETSAHVVESTCAGIMGRNFAKKWSVKCSFKLAEGAPAGDMQVAAQGTARTPNGIAPVMGSVTIKKE